jgi:tetratricopeptide (TPR) repeat protein
VYCERYLYLPSIAFCLLAGSVGARLLERSGYRGGVRVALVLIIVALVARTHLRNRDWVDDLSLWTVTARQSPHDHDVLYNYAKSLEVASRERHRDEEERRVLRDRAILTHERALALEPGRPESRVNLAPLLLRRRGPGDLQRARDILEEGLGYGDDAQLRNNLAVVLRALGDEDGALLAFGRAFGLDSAFGGAYAEALHRKGRNDEAAEVLGRVLEEREDDVLLLRLAALVARARGRKGEALEYVRRALRLDPERKGLRLLQEELLGEQ